MKRHASIDTARGFAIVAMIVAHTRFFVRDVTPYGADIGLDLLNDVASPLFALVIGVTVGITTAGAAAPERPERTGFLTSWVLKAFLLIGSGWLLGLRSSGTVIVLEMLGTTMLVAAPFLLLRTRWQVTALVVVAAVGPALNAAARDSTWATTSDGLARELLDWTVLSHYFRVTGLLPLLLLGLVLARWQLGDRRRTALVLAVGLALAPLGQLAVRHEARTGTAWPGSWGDLTRDIGLSLVAYGAVVLLCDHAPPAVRSGADRVLRPVSAMGAMALTIYALHLVVLMLIVNETLSTEGELLHVEVERFVMPGLLVLCAVVAMAWRRWLGAGPVERVVRVLSLRHPPRTLVANSHDPA
jgi:uncharacterized membrane protein YeiB